MFAHIFKASTNTGYKYTLLITSTPSVNDMSNDKNSEELFFNTTAEAKHAAMDRNATPHNY
jgi:hypothetical protein